MVCLKILKSSSFAYSTSGRIYLSKNVYTIDLHILATPAIEKVICVILHKWVDKEQILWLMTHLFFEFSLMHL
jgi:hypothetical protein